MYLPTILMYNILDVSHLKSSSSYIFKIIIIYTHTKIQFHTPTNIII